MVLLPVGRYGGGFGKKPKDNVGDMTVLDSNKNPWLLNILKTNVIMVGLNFSRNISEIGVFQNFHDSGPYANDFKIRYAFYDTPYYGAYMTDLIKNFPEVNSNYVKQLLRTDSEIINKSLREFVEELVFIEAKEPVIFCFGHLVYNLLASKLEQRYYRRLVPLKHYSCWMSKESYKKHVLERIRIFLE